MSASQLRGQLERKRKQRIDAEKKAGDARSKESAKRAAADKARQAAAKASSDSTRKMKLREADRRDAEAAQAGKDGANWQTKVSNLAKEEATLAGKVTKAELAEAQAGERSRKREEQRAAAERAAMATTLNQTVETVDEVVRHLRAPKQEKLRILILGASSDGGLRVGREQKRIRAAVESALHRDLVELDVRPAATTADLLDGISQFRPHVVHFSGHSGADVIEFEDDVDERQDAGVIVTARAFANAVAATDDPPLLVLLNSCNSAAQINDLVAHDVAPLAIGMADEIDDADAINYAARFYAAVANGQSVSSAHLSGRAALELAGLDGADLPTLACAPGVDPRQAVLVRPDPVP
jgi:hypothetical protein